MDNHGLSYKNTKRYNIPNFLNDTILFIEGLVNKDYKTRIIYSEKQKNSDPGYVGREVIDKLYNILNLNINNNVSICSVEYQSNGGFSVNDLTNIQQLNKIEKTLNVTIVGDNIGTDTESQLDIQMRN